LNVAVGATFVTCTVAVSIVLEPASETRTRIVRVAGPSIAAAEKLAVCVLPSSKAPSLSRSHA
jgi:hypothetical protein